MTLMRSIIVAGLTLILLLLALPVLAQNKSSPFSDAENIRQQLFKAQSSLLLNNQTAAQTAVNDAYTLYQSTLKLDFAKSVPEVEKSLEDAFKQAIDAVQNNDGLTLAFARSTIWTGFLNASQQLTDQFIQANDPISAGQWFLLREFQSSTKFSRPSADGTKALQLMVAGTGKPQDTLNAVRNDLLGSYESQLLVALANAEDAQHQNFGVRQAEEIGLANGYFNILAQTYRDQRGADALQKVQADFKTLTQLTLKQSSDQFQTILDSIRAGLKDFRAAPLSQDEQARRAGQLIRFIGLVPIEYKRGIRNGVVVKGIEIQEALTFLDASTASFADITLTLKQADTAKTDRVVALLTEMKSQIQGTSEPTALENNTNEVQNLLKDIVPAEWQQIASNSDMDVITSVIDQIPVAVRANQFESAESARLEAYGLLELGMEQRLRGFAPDLAANIEGLFWQGGAASATDGSIDKNTPLRGLADLIAAHAPIEEINTTIAALKVSFTAAQDVIGAGKSSPTVVIGNSAIIVFREGLEAVLILASLLASLRTAEEQQFRRPIVIGAVLALLASVVTWWLANQLLQTMLPLGERLSAIVSIIAIIVLLIITNWFFHKVYWTGWMAGFHTKKRTLINGVAVVTLGQAIGLVILGFTSIYRELFESVLFMQSLVLDAGMGVVLQGVALGLLGVSIVGVIAFTLQRKLPYKKMLVVTGVMIGFVLLTMVGHTAHAMQVVGWMPITPIVGISIPLWMGQWFGLFATWQGIGYQIASGIFVIGSYFLAEHLNHKKRNDAMAETQQQNIPQPTLETST